MSKSSLSLRPKCDQKGHDTSSKEGLKRVRNNLENFTHFFSECKLQVQLCPADTEQFMQGFKVYGTSMPSLMQSP